MNYKLLFPTYRNRYNFVRRNLEKFAGTRPFDCALNLGTGEGDYDPMIARHCRRLIACDINAQDVAFARRLNAHLPNVDYRVENALELRFDDGSFDAIVTVDVLEHVGKPERMVAEMARVLRPGGWVFITFPQLHFPWTYDPINYLLGRRAIPQGAYAFGHEYLIDPAEFKRWSESHGLEVLEECNLSGYLVGLLEMYWTGVVQRLFKANATNLDRDGEKPIRLRPSTREPALAKLTDAVLWLDRELFSSQKHSVGKGFVLRKRIA
ncbi:MAG: SAM-dependent methyltransferase [Bacteroidetes bacterium]|nr:MAG: SAM-dependent methyltransferase [Bacteroidota bacterium]